MYILAINGSPRENWNTAKLLQSALEGADSCGAVTEMILQLICRRHMKQENEWQRMFKKQFFNYAKKFWSYAR